MTAMLHARFRHTYPGFSFDIDCRLPGHGVTALFGHSGSGKTTCLRLIAGLERAASGFLSVEGEIWQDDSRGQFIAVHKRPIGYVFQEPGLFPHLSVSQNLDYGRRRRSGADSGDSEILIELLGIGYLLGRSPVTLSGGERQRVAIARALLAGPRLLLLDEPLAALDLPRKREILPYLERLRETVSFPILYVSHSPEEVIRLADHIVLLEAGRAVASGPLATTLARLDLPSQFNADFGVIVEGFARGYDSTHRLLTLAFPGGNLHVSHASVPDGRRLRVQIMPRDVSIALQQPTETSILNILPSVVTGIAPNDETGHTLIGLEVGSTPLSARITRYSCDRLQLRVGQLVWAQIKAVAVLA
jgi:molybdate transport system ATP-binding protein